MSGTGPSSIHFIDPYSRQTCRTVSAVIHPPTHASIHSFIDEHAKHHTRCYRSNDTVLTLKGLTRQQREMR